MSQLNLNKTCSKLGTRYKILDNLNVVYNEFWDNFLLWSKYEIFIFRPLNPKYMVKIELNFQITQVISSQYYLICLDTTGVVQIAKLKDKSPGVTYEHFNAIEKNAIFMTRDQKFIYILTIKNGTCFLLIYKLDEFSMKINYQINVNDINLSEELNYRRCKMHCHLINNTETFVFITFDGFLVHYVTINHSDRLNNVEAKTLINCPSEINDIHYTNNSILISMSIGTVIKMYWDTKIFKDKRIIHLNTAVHRIKPVNDSLVYTDGQTMWQVKNIFSDNLIFSQYYVKLVKDFTIFNNEVICTTYGEHYYIFSLDDETSYQQPDSSVEYCSVTRLLKDKDYMQDIVTEVEKNYEITKKIKLEENYITTIALSNRQDILNDVLHYDFEIYEQYEDIVQKCNITLTNDIKDYYELDSHYLLIKLTIANIHQKFNDVLSNMFGNLEMHITLFSSNKVLKNITLKIYEQLKNMNIAVPLQTVVLENKKLKVLIELITRIPGALDKKQSLWIKLHTKEAILNAEHFIKTIIPTNNIRYLKKTPEITSLVCENAIKHHGHLVKLINGDNKNTMKWKFFTRLPENYKEILSNEQSYKSLNSVQRKLVMKELSSESFLSSRNTVVLNIANEKVEIDINTGFPNDFLQITSANVQIASDIRIFLSNILFAKQEITKDYVSATILQTMGTLKQQIDDCVSYLQPIEDFLPLHEKYQKNVISRLNL